MKPFIEYLRQYYGDTPLTGIEIGVLTGENALDMLYTLKMEKLYLIDPYMDYPEYDKTELGRAKPVIDLNLVYDQAVKRLSPYRNAEILKRKSCEAVNGLPEVDFVYIDGNHAYEYVKQDIALYYPKVKKGGVIGGDNIELDNVRNAVGEFLTKYQLPIQVSDYSYYVEWWFVKR